MDYESIKQAVIDEMTANYNGDDPAIEDILKTVIGVSLDAVILFLKKCDNLKD